MTTTTRSKRKTEIYVVVDGFSPTSGVFSSWGHVHPRVTGYQNAKFKKFATVLQAETHMENAGVKEYTKMAKSVSVEATLKWGEKAYYAVVNGRSMGIQEYYFGADGVELEVVNFSGACHKRFSSRTQAEDFISDWVEIYSYICKNSLRRSYVEESVHYACLRELMAVCSAHRLL